MRKRWLWFVLAVLLVGLIVPILILRKPDGLEFIRKYRPKSEKMTYHLAIPLDAPSSSNDEIWERVFTFDSLPPGLISELEGTQGPGYKTDWQMSQLPSRTVLAWDKEQGIVKVMLWTSPPLLERTWFSLVERFSRQR